MRRQTWRSAIGSLCLLAFSALSGTAALGDDYPSKPVKIIMPSAAGNGPDVIGRIVAEHLTQLWGQQTLVINRPGAGGLLAAQAAVSAQPDGYTLLQAISSTLLILPALQKLPFDLERDLVPVGLVGEQPFVVAVAPSRGIKTLSELIALAQKRPAEIMYGAANRGSMPHLAGELFRTRAGIDVTFVPYPSTSQTLHDIMGGQIAMIVESVSALAGSIEGGSLTPLAVTSAKRLPELPDLPTVSEVIPRFGAAGWFALMAPAGTPDLIVQKLNRDLRTVLLQPDVQKQFAKLGTYGRGLSPTETGEFIHAERQLWKPIVDQIGLVAR
jgi:tripartite-type tricarboxylate transporter receptor subunit TctC